MTIRLRDLQVCFEGVIPSIIATASPGGVPNISYLSHVALVDDEHVALSDQFFSKTAANIRGNNNAAVMLVDPRDGSQYRLSVILSARSTAACCSKPWRPSSVPAARKSGWPT